MAMGIRSIMVGRAYQARDGEVREVTAIDNEIVTYRALSVPAGPGVIARSAERRMALTTFADEAEGEAGP